jgi:hypothetical protein
MAKIVWRGWFELSVAIAEDGTDEWFLVFFPDALGDGTLSCEGICGPGDLFICGKKLIV